MIEEAASDAPEKGRRLLAAFRCKKKTPGCTGGSGEALAMMKK